MVLTTLKISQEDLINLQFHLITYKKIYKLNCLHDSSTFHLPQNERNHFKKLHCTVYKIYSYNNNQPISNLLPTYKTDGWLVGWVLWHINLCWVFTAKSIFMQ